MNQRLWIKNTTIQTDIKYVYMIVYDKPLCLSWCSGFKTEIEAFNAYKQAKENYLKELATKWKDKIDTRAYNALMEYQVEITD